MRPEPDREMILRLWKLTSNPEIEDPVIRVQTTVRDPGTIFKDPQMNEQFIVLLAYNEMEDRYFVQTRSVATLDLICVINSRIFNSGPPNNIRFHFSGGYLVAGIKEKMIR